ncbi:MAG: TIGR00725 family protein [Candidatus Helarchaeota archaeon]
MRQVALIGEGFLEKKRVYDLTVEIGKKIANIKNLILICGGKGGAMEAVCKGIHEGNGLSIGILPSTDPNEANKYVKIKIPTGLGEKRNYLIVQSAEVIICVAGQIGTKMEADYALKLKKPLITIPQTGGISKEYSEKYKDEVFVASNSDEVISLMKKILKI